MSIKKSTNLSIGNKLFQQEKFSEALKYFRLAKQELPMLTKFIEFNMNLAQSKIKNDIVVRENESQHSNLTKIEPLNFNQLSKDVFVGIAAIPERKDALEKVVHSLINQVPKIGVYLNGWNDIPDFLKNEKIIIAGIREPDIGDIGKFHWVDQHDGVYFTCDDDLIYPADYISRMLNKLEYYKFNAAVGWHGSLLLDPFKKYYDKNSRRVFTFSSHRPYDTPVHILGTGCCAFHTSKLEIKKSDFLYPNMADIFFSIKGQESKLPFYIIKHEKDEIIEVQGSKDSSIFTHSSSNSNSKKNTHDLQNEYIRQHMPWTLNSFTPLNLLIIGRFNNYKKGGIYKSCHLIEKTLSALGHSVTVLDTQENLSDSILDNIDLCWIYPGDPERPDFETVDNKINELQQYNIPVLVNLSYLYEPSRTKYICDKLINYNKTHKTPVLAAVFTESAANDPGFNQVRDFICVVPKTLLPTPYAYVPSFAEREGICLGDATKLSNPKIIGGNVHPWIEAIHRKLPHVNLYAYKQYQGQNPPHPKVKFVPHMTDSFGEWLAHRRLFICANVHLTFEMVSCEAQQYGTPIIYRHMPHSLSEYISATGLAVRTPDEMAEMVSWLYNSSSAWTHMSQSSIHNANSNHIDVLGSSLEGYLRLALHRAKRLQQQ